MYRIVCVARAFIYFFIVQNLYEQNPIEFPVLHPKHGFFNLPLDVSMTTGTINIQMLYTTDGSEPTLQNNKVYAESIHLEKTTVLRARIKNSANGLDPVITQTYIFPIRGHKEDDKNGVIQPGYAKVG